jgi:hypothetical protein
MNNIVTVTTETGVKIVGPADAVRQLVGTVAFDGAVNHDEWYHSSSKGFIRIKSMASQHIKNAMLKIYDNWMTSLRMAKTPGEFTKLLESGPKDADTILGLAKELGRRNLHGRTWTYSGDK